MNPWSGVGRGLETVASQQLRDAPNAVPVVSKAAHYAGRGYSFLDSLYALGPNAALTSMRMSVTFYGALYGAAACGVFYWLTTDRVQLSSDSYRVEKRIVQQLSNDYLVKRNRWTGRERVVEALSDGNREVYFKAHVNRLLYTYVVYKSMRHDAIAVDLEPELNPTRFAVKDLNYRRSRSVHDRSVSEQDLAVKRIAEDDDPGRSRGRNKELSGDNCKARLVLSFDSRARTHKDMDQGLVLLVREAIATAAREVFGEGYRQWMEDVKYGNEKRRSDGSERNRVFVDALIRNGVWDGAGATPEGVMCALAGVDDPRVALARFEERVLDRARANIGRDGIVCALTVDLRNGTPSSS